MKNSKFKKGDQVLVVVLSKDSLLPLGTTFKAVIKCKCFKDNFIRVEDQEGDCWDCEGREVSLA